MDSTDRNEFHRDGHRELGRQIGVQLLGGDEKGHGHRTDPQGGEVGLGEQGADVHQGLRTEGGWLITHELTSIKINYMH